MEYGPHSVLQCQLFLLLGCHGNLQMLHYLNSPVPADTYMSFNLSSGEFIPSTYIYHSATLTCEIPSSVTSVHTHLECAWPGPIPVPQAGTGSCLSPSRRCWSSPASCAAASGRDPASSLLTQWSPRQRHRQGSPLTGRGGERNPTDLIHTTGREMTVLATYL